MTYSEHNLNAGEFLYFFVFNIVQVLFLQQYFDWYIPSEHFIDHVTYTK